MTIDTVQEGGSTMPWSDGEWGNAGLEDVSASDVILPRLSINHSEGLFEDNLSGSAFPVLKAVILGMVKQRIMWGDELEDGQKPQCKSPNAIYGFPNMRPDADANEQFPWADSVFTPEQATPVELEATKQFPNGWSSNGYPVIPCATCNFAEWEKDAKGKNVPPRCSEQHTYILQYTGDDSGTWTTALLTLHRTGIKPSRAYVSSFAQKQQPMFTVYTELSLEQNSRGSVRYSVPKFKTIGPTDQSDWETYYETYNQVRAFVRSAPRQSDDSVDEPTVAPSENLNTPPTPKATEPKASSPAPASAPVAEPVATAVTPDDDDLPF